MSRADKLRGRAVGGRGRIRVAVEDRGYKTPCWIWTQPDFSSDYYGRHKSNGGIVAAHRSFYIAKYGPIPEGLELDHLCRQLACVNPAHLEPVTSTVNMRRSNTTKLTVEQVREIKTLRATIPQTANRPRNGQTRAIAERYGVTPHNISAIWAGRSWADA